MRGVPNYRSLVAGIPCLACGDPQVQLHHAKGGSIADSGVDKGMGQKTGDANLIPLCMDHHTGQHGIHTVGVLTWEAEYGRQIDMVKEVQRRAGFEARMVVTPERKRAAISKILPRRTA